MQGDSSEAKYLPKFFHKCLPLSILALQQNYIDKLKKHWECRWKSSPREDLLKAIDNSTLSVDNSTPSEKYLHLIAGLDHRQAFLPFELHMVHAI